MTPLSFSFAEMLYERYAYQKEDDRAVRSPVSHTIFIGISMKSQFYHSSRFTSPSSNSFLKFLFLLFSLLFFLLFSFLSLSAIFFSSRDRAHGSPVATFKVTFCSAVSSTISVQSRTREIARRSHGIKYATERVDVYVYVIVSRLISLVR